MKRISKKQRIAAINSCKEEFEQFKLHMFDAITLAYPDPAESQLLIQEAKGYCEELDLSFPALIAGISGDVLEDI